jgi:hypothetical protein
MVEQKLVSVRYVPLSVGVLGELLQGACCTAALLYHGHRLHMSTCGRTLHEE